MSEKELEEDWVSRYFVLSSNASIEARENQLQAMIIVTSHLYFQSPFIVMMIMIFNGIYWYGDFLSDAHCITRSAFPYFEFEIGNGSQRKRSQ